MKRAAFGPPFFALKQAPMMPNDAGEISGENPKAASEWIPAGAPNRVRQRA